VELLVTTKSVPVRDGKRIGEKVYVRHSRLYLI
jgi:hypothetical protein